MAQDTRTLQKRRKAQENYQGIPVPTFVVDENHVVTHWNRACELLTGQTAAEMVGTKNHPNALCDKSPYKIADLLLEKRLTQNPQEYDNTVFRESSIVAGAYEAEIHCSNSEVNHRKCKPDTSPTGRRIPFNR